MNSAIETERVYIGKCSEYDVNKIEDILKQSIKYIGFKIPNDKRILIKPNVLGAYEPEVHVTTHPKIVEAMIRILLANNNKIIIGDSSGVRISGGTDLCLQKAGFKDLQKKYEVEVRSFEEPGSDIYEDDGNKVLKKIHLTKIIGKVDYIINVPKLKSHQLTRYTGGVKNLFGCVPGGLKQECHVKAPNPEEFSQLLVDIYSLVRPKLILNIMDGIIGLEGAGPGPSGEKINTGLIIVSQDAVALDIACSKIIGLNPKEVYTTQFAVKRELFNKNIKTNINIPTIKYIIPKPLPLPRFITKYFARFGHHKPVVNKEKCKSCSYCSKVCPPQALTMKKYPVLDYDKCIYCYCCHENCPHGAIYLKDNIFLKVYKLFAKRRS
ncbi:MAG: DUF362 domain-containing protein [Candidatus Woesearchaeota archaeon]